MKLLALQLNDWRNLEQALLELHPRFNVLAGDNAQGKTNLLEALYFLGTLRSFRAGKTEELIRFGQPEARVKARVERSGLARVLEVSVRPGTRTARIDGKVVRTAADWFGGFNAVLFAPEDLALPKGSPSQRRRFLDRAIFCAQASYLKLAQEYERILRSRNAILREAPASSRGRSIEPLLETYDEQLATAGAAVVERRSSYVEQLREPFASAFESVTQSGVRATVRYLTETPDLEAIRAALRETRRRDLLRGHTTAGPHVDDLEILLDERPARLFGSQGQLRAAVLSLKIAEIEHLEKTLGESPVLMLDDVSSELDPRRNQYLFEFLRKKSCQCVITTTDRRHILLTEDRKDFQVVKGQIPSEK